MRKDLVQSRRDDVVKLTVDGMFVHLKSQTSSLCARFCIVLVGRWRAEVCNAADRDGPLTVFPLPGRCRNSPAAARNHPHPRPENRSYIMCVWQGATDDEISSMILNTQKQGNLESCREP